MPFAARMPLSTLSQYHPGRGDYYDDMMSCLIMTITKRIWFIAHRSLDSDQKKPIVPGQDLIKTKSSQRGG